MAISAISSSQPYANYAAGLRARTSDSAAEGADNSASKAENTGSASTVNANGRDQASGEAAPAASGDEKVKAKSEAKKGELTPEQLDQIARLQARDREVRQHEAAHLAASGGLATSGASFTYQKGADGINYAIGGEVSIDTSPGRTPQETIQRAQTIQAAALAPADPSGPDRAVASAAQQMAAQARVALAKEAIQPAKSDKSPSAEGTASVEAADAEKKPDQTAEKNNPQASKAVQVAQAYGQFGANSASHATKSSVSIYA